MNIKINIVYGEEDFKELFQNFIDVEIRGIICRVKNDYKVRYNDIDYLSSKEITEVGFDE